MASTLGRRHLGRRVSLCAAIAISLVSAQPVHTTYPADPVTGLCRAGAGLLTIDDTKGLDAPSTCVDTLGLPMKFLCNGQTNIAVYLTICTKPTCLDADCYPMEVSRAGLCEEFRWLQQTNETGYIRTYIRSDCQFIPTRLPSITSSVSKSSSVTPSRASRSRTPSRSSTRRSQSRTPSRTPSQSRIRVGLPEGPQ